MSGETMIGTPPVQPPLFAPGNRRACPVCRRHLEPCAKPKECKARFRLEINRLMKVLEDGAEETDVEASYTLPFDIALTVANLDSRQARMEWASEYRSKFWP